MDEYKPAILKQKWEIRSAKEKDSEYMQMIKGDLDSAWNVINTAVRSSRLPVLTHSFKKTGLLPLVWVVSGL